MNILFFVLKWLHYLTCIGLIIVVLLQSGKSGIIGGQSIFGWSSGADQIFSVPSRKAFISKLIIFMACVFLLTSLLLTKFYVNMSEVSVIK
ncbi:MAG: preprotein translocase subunit SecG [Endomicrobium sp.]|jgi:preprotein translocase subunit SecG|nr:preprotein translocase subunit SecG [Endomicrobium sp.]